MAYSNPNKVNGFAAGAGEHFSSNTQYFTVNTTVNLATTLMTNAVASQSLLAAALANNALAFVNGETALDKVIEIIAQRGQPIIMSAVTNVGSFYYLNFATEHWGSWNVTGNFVTDNSAIDLAAAIVAGGADYGLATGGGNTVVVTTSATFP